MVLKAFTSHHFIHSINYFILDLNQQQTATSRARCLMKESGKTGKPKCLFCDYSWKEKTRYQEDLSHDERDTGAY